MMTVKHAILVGGFAVAAVLGLVAVAAPAEAKRCPSGTVQSKFEGVCVKGASGGGLVPVLPPSGGGPVIGGQPGGLATVNGIPCTKEHYGTCLAMTQQP
ncbi:hypothetical protein H7J87_14330 [Mycolicibacterium wolinskyi]|uniref:Intersectin-EH binding protein Ibp1 n=2 Tax=Mycobacteriaceae TaxID=1762 RepID=A0A1X2F9W9_9MYCO|nr:hypothetical protein [Mycolicibacterium wolinskyi]MCV7293483.1 hypothetical protein [Mycolicibacterium goodii]ORX14769.1 hypothetical protein AWC31_26790 [Mycolicibacterium wolinskyi]